MNFVIGAPPKLNIEALALYLVYNFIFNLIHCIYKGLSPSM
jgi:hypothetical protein